MFFDILSNESCFKHMLMDITSIVTVQAYVRSTILHASTRVVFVVVCCVHWPVSEIRIFWVQNLCRGVRAHKALWIKKIANLFSTLKLYISLYIYAIDSLNSWCDSTFCALLDNMWNVVIRQLQQDYSAKSLAICFPPINWCFTLTKYCVTVIIYK